MTTRAGLVAMMPAMTIFENPGCLSAAASLLCLLQPVDLCAQSKERANKVRRQLEREVQGKPAALQHPQEQQHQDPIQKLISDLETGDYGLRRTAAGQAYRELKKLGVLVLPTIHKRLLELNPFGIRAALELAVEYPTPELYRNLELMLEDRDLGKQILAARVLYRLPPDKVRKHVELAGKSSHPVVRLGALHARAIAGADVKPILAEIKPLLRRPEKDVCNGAATVLRSMDDPRVKKVLEELLLDWHDDFWAVQRWIDLTDPEDEAAALGLYERLESTRARAALVKSVIRQRPKWLRIQARGMEVLVEDGQPYYGAPMSNQNARGAIFQRLSRESTSPAPSKTVLKELLRKETGGSGWAATFVITRPRKPEWVPLVEQAMFMHELKGGYFHQAFAWMEQAAPERLLARASELLDGPSTDGISRLLAERGDVSHVPLAVRWFRTHGGLSRSGLVYLVREKSDRTSLPALIRLARLPCPIASDAQQAANEALGRWFVRQDIPTALDAIWSVNASFARAILENVRRVATRADIPRIVRLMQAASERLRDWGRSWKARPDVAPSPGMVFAATVNLLGGLGGQDAVDALLPLLEHRVPEVSQFVARQLLSMKGVDRKKILKRLLAGEIKEHSLWDVMRDPLARTDEEVRSLVEKALLALPNADWENRHSDTYAYLKALSKEQGTAMALRILAAQKERVAVWNSPTAAALQLLGDQEDAVKFIPQMAQWLRDSDVHLRLAAVGQLGRTYSPQAVPHLLQALKDEQQSVRNMATSILERFETYRSQVERFRKLTTTKWPEPVKPKSGKKD